MNRPIQVKPADSESRAGRMTIDSSQMTDLRETLSIYYLTHTYIHTHTHTHMYAPHMRARTRTHTHTQSDTWPR